MRIMIQQLPKLMARGFKQLHVPRLNILTGINWVNKPDKLRFATNRVNTCPCWSNAVLYKCPDNAFDIGVEVFWMSSSLSYLVNVYDHDRGILLTRQHDVFAATDRKSTRLNSSHVATSYAVFCLKKKKD